MKDPRMILSAYADCPQPIRRHMQLWALASLTPFWHVRKRQRRFDKALSAMEEDATPMPDGYRRKFDTAPSR